jgi:hypothetical protein
VAHGCMPCGDSPASLLRPLLSLRTDCVHLLLPQMILPAISGSSHEALASTEVRQCMCCEDVSCLVLI